ncbi:CBN-ALP-1 protein [Aphelenchoides avenae]|nr:CBN-ALP-1 protein [Aphelenchus avenae]
MESADYRDYEMVTVRMSRGELTTQWGFSVKASGIISNVTGGGLADRAGLREGDLIDEIQGLRCPSPETVQLLYHSAKHQIDLTVLREPANAVRLWRPDIVEDEANRYANHANESSHNRDIHVSLEHTRQSHPTVPGFNKAPRKFPNEVLTESYVTSNNRREPQTGGVLAKPVPPMTQFKPTPANEPSYEHSETLRLIRSQAGETQRSALKRDGPATKDGQPKCFACGRNIVGLTCEVGNVYLHPECFQCSTCGAPLRNQGHHFIDDKFYCDVHGTQRRHPTPDMGSRMLPQSTVKLPEPVKQPRRHEAQNVQPITKSTNAPLSTGPRGVAEGTFTRREQYAATGCPKRRVKRLGIIWPPPRERSKRLEAIRYWKFQPDGIAAVLDPSGQDRLRNLQALISGFETGSPLCVAHSDTSSDVDACERPYTYSKKVIPTPHRLLTPMRNPMLVDLRRTAPDYDIMPRISVDSLPSHRSPFAIGVQPKPLSSLFAADENDSIASITGTQETCHSTSTSDYLEAPLPRHDIVSSSLNSQCNQRLPWQLIPEVVEERDIATESSMIGIEDTLFNEVDFNIEDSRSRRSSETLRPHEESYERSGSVDDEERERWIREDLEQARMERHEFLNMKPPSKPMYDVTRTTSRKGKPSATRDAALQQIERHQENLQYQQEKLSELLENAIKCLHNLEEADAKLQMQQALTAEPSHEASESDPFEGLELGSFVHLQLENDIFVDDKSSVIRGSEVRRSLSPFQALDPPLNAHAGESVRQRATLVNQATRVPVCEFCRKDIRGAFVLATGKAWCPEHFTCSNSACNRQLLDCGFVEEKGHKYCEKCFETLIAPICGKCGLPITADCLNALQKQWHPECFVCAHCRKPFGNSAFYLENAQPYCEQDWNMLFTTKCTSCKYPIEAGDRWVEALGGAFHSNCFSCTVCQTNLEGQSFYAKDGKPFCRTHA